jgi:hypothetical protein
MSGNNPSTITFYDNHIPALEDGDYEITVTQTLTIDGTTKTIEGSSPNPQLSFTVEGPRFNLDSSLIHSVFPPRGGKGDFRSCLPTLILNRSTLPWERTPFEASPDKVNPPWLFLLLIDESENSLVNEQPNAALTSISSLKLPSGKPLVAEADQSRYANTKLNYLQVDQSLKGLLPSTLNELLYLSYARSKSKNPNFPSEEHAVLLCNRLPQPGHNSTVYLISLENNYSGCKLDSTFTGIAQQVTDDNKIVHKNYVFPYLYKWQFHAVDDKFYVLDENKVEKINETIKPASPLNLSSIPMGQLYKSTGEFKAALPTTITDSKVISVIESIAEIPGSTFHGMLANLEGGFFPLTLAPTANDITSSGSLQLTYLQSLKTASDDEANATQAWYRGPLAATSIDFSGLSGFPDLTKDIVTKGTIQLMLNLDYGVWESSDETVGSVLNGVITALNTGTCNITFTNDEATVTFSVSITQDSTTKDLLISVINGPGNQPNEYDVKSAIMDTYEKGRWSSSDNNTATIAHGLVQNINANTFPVTCSDSIYTITFVIDITSNSLNPLPQHAQALVLQDITNQIEDISYAAAFELGRLTALDDVSFTKEFYKWKSQTATAMRLSALSANSNYKSTFQLTPNVSQLINPMPEHVVQKFTAWKYLEGIPFRYIVPQSKMLPNESIRFFTLDNSWINAFISGAFSIGHTAQVDFSPYLKGLFLGNELTISGILINSMVVSGWPDFMVDAYSKNGTEIQLLRKVDIDENIRLYLVSGSFDQLDFYLHHGKTHSGFMFNNNQFTKLDGNIIVTPDKNNIIDVADLSTKLNAQSIAEFGGLMLEGIPTVVFNITN